jgi:integrase
MFDTYELAREFKHELGAGKTSRRPLSSKTVADYYEGWLPNYRGRTARGLQDSSRRELETSFRLHVLPLPIARLRMRDLGAPDVRAWLHELERRGTPPRTIGKAKAALSAMLSCAVEDGDLGSNAATSARYVPSAEAMRRHAKPKPKELTAADIMAILGAMPEEWRAFFTLLAQTGVRIGELLALTWAHVHLGDDPHIMVVEQIHRGKRKPKLKTDKSRASVPLSPDMAAWLAALRPEGAAPHAPVFASKTGTALNYANVYNRVLRPALERSGIAVVVDHRKVVRRGKPVEVPVWDYRRIGFHAFRHACGSLLHASGGKTLAQMQGWLRHSQLSTTLDVYTHPVDGGLGGAEVWDEILPVTAIRGATIGATGHPEAGASGTSGEANGTAS